MEGEVETGGGRNGEVVEDLTYANVALNGDHNNHNSSS